MFGDFSFIRKKLLRKEQETLWHSGPKKRAVASEAEVDMDPFALGKSKRASLT
jgi:hypothetical protein